MGLQFIHYTSGYRGVVSVVVRQEQGQLSPHPHKCRRLGLHLLLEAGGLKQLVWMTHCQSISVSGKTTQAQIVSLQMMRHEYTFQLQISLIS